VFAVDLPKLGERMEILKIHLRKRGRDVKLFDLDTLGEATENFVGAEIESVVDEALYDAFAEDREATTADLLAVAAKIVPISKTDKESIDAFREWMRTRATPVSSSGGKNPEADRKLRNLRLKK
jgi:SpoVK/Ycf46/Vps4 family AAA+-type ATPase